MMRYRYEDEDGDALSVNEHEGHPGHALVKARGGASIPPAEFPKIMAALYEAAGLPVPVILTAPEPGGMLVRGPHGGELADVEPSPAGSPQNAPGVMLSLHDGSRRVTVRLIADEPLKVAAALVTAMREAEANPEPDPAELEALASLLHRVQCDAGNDCVRVPNHSDFIAARAILLGGWKREPES